MGSSAHLALWCATLVLALMAIITRLLNNCRNWDSSRMRSVQQTILIIGDIVFFDYTGLDKNTGKPQKLTHEGIVVDSGGAGKGIVGFIHANWVGVTEGYMDLTDPTNVQHNSVIGDTWCLDTGSHGCRSGQLFNSYGTIRDVSQ
jgi:hypothetical protein